MSLNDDWRARSLRAVWHPCTQMKLHEGQPGGRPGLPLVPVVRAEGVWLHDAEGRRILDGISRLADQRPPDFERRIEPLRRRVETAQWKGNNLTALQRTAMGPAGCGTTPSARSSVSASGATSITAGFPGTAGRTPSTRSER